MSENLHIRNLKLNKRNLVEVVVIASLIGMGINLISTSLYNHFTINHKNLVFCLFGGMLLFVALLYFIKIFFFGKSATRKYEGFIVIDKKSNLPVECNGYVYSEELNQYFVGAFDENKSIKRIWDGDNYSTEDKSKIVIEATEFFILNELSTHLEDYTNSHKLEKFRVQTISRNDIPNILLKNRFLELFSKPQEERDNFIDYVEDNKKNSNEDKIYGSYLSSGAMFILFELVLPKNSSVIKKDDVIIIDTPRFTISFKVNYEHLLTSLPRNYVEYFLDLVPFFGCSERYINIDLTVRYKWNSYFITSDWEYYEWLDLFLEKIEEIFEKKNYFSKIQWDNVITQTIINQKIISKQK